MIPQMPTTQQLFDAVVDHLFTQRAKAIDSGGSCRYRSATGLKCAVGALIADEYYSPDLEGGNVDAATVQSAVEDSIGRSLSLNDRHMLRMLQIFHDSAGACEWDADGTFNPLLANTHCGIIADRHALAFAPRT